MSQNPNCLESPYWDSFWILNGLWLLLVIIFLLSSNLDPLYLSKFVFWGLLFFWGGHIFSPFITAWSIPEFRTRMIDRKVIYIFRPMALLFGVVIITTIGVKFSGELFPDSLMGHLQPHILIIYLFLLWNTWHFSAQHFGVLSLYRYRQGVRAEKQRSIDRYYTVAMTCVLLPIAWYTQSQVLGPLFLHLPLPEPQGLLAQFNIVISILLCLAMLVNEFRQGRKFFPRGAYILTIALQPILASVSYIIFNAILFSLSHWIIAIALSGRILANQFAPQSETGQKKSSPSHIDIFHTMVAGLLLLSIPMYYLFWSDDIMGHIAHDTYQYISSGFQADGAKVLMEIEGTTIVGVLVGLYFGLSFVHFYYDRALYSFRNSDVRKIVAPRLFGRLSKQG